MRILVTGHMGNLGSQFFQALNSGKHNLYGVDTKDNYDCKVYFKTTLAPIDIVIHCADDTDLAHKLAIDSELAIWVQKVKPKLVVYVQKEWGVRFDAGVELVRNYILTLHVVKEDNESDTKFIQDTLNETLTHI